MYITNVTPYAWYDDSDKCTYVPLKNRTRATCMQVFKLDL